MEGMEEFPTGSSPWKKGKDAGRMQALLEKCREWKDAKLASLKACPAAKDFPGVPENGAQTVRRTVEIDSNIGGWHSTGLYAPPGAEISCSLSGAPKDGSISVRIGCHTDSLHKLDEWKRVPEITMQVSAGRGRVKMVNPMGGLVYVNVGQRPRRGKVFKVQISGAVPSPLFVMGKTTPEQWAEQLENTKAPWGEIRMPRLIVTMPVEQLKQCPDVQKTAEFLQKTWLFRTGLWDGIPSRTACIIRCALSWTGRYPPGPGIPVIPPWPRRTGRIPLPPVPSSIPEAGVCGMNWGITTNPLPLRWKARRRYPSTYSPWCVK